VLNLPPIADPWPLKTAAEIEAEKAQAADRPPTLPETITDPKRRPLR
jgi:hypothetical protein